jgi:O-antigen/teichoic acid export membrane protein
MPVMRTIKTFFGAEGMTLAEYRKATISRFKEDSLFRNSVYLLASTISMSLFGFVFWVLTTRLYSVDQIGLATAVISATTLLASFSMFGFNTGLVRYLPQSERWNETINTVIITVASLTLIVSTGYVIGIGYFAPEFGIVKEVPLYGALFILFMLVVSINMLTDSIFVAYRASKYNLAVYLSFGIAKIAFPLLFLGLATNGVLLSYIGSVIVAFLLTFYILIKKFKYRFSFVVRGNILKSMTGFSVGNYIATFISAFPGLALPTVIVTTLGASDSAYFYIASTIAALLYGIPQAISQSLLAEGSHAKETLKELVFRASKLISVIVLTGIVFFILLGRYVLLIFGRDYAEHSSLLLSVMAITAIFTAINIIASTILRVQQRIRPLIIISIGYVLVTMALVFMLIHRGIIGVGLALFFGQLFMSIEYAILFSFSRKPKDL